ncbi:MAG TPA: type IV toxin-antitoxin system AbiEi family antitoxin domain-containing protein, partial [Pseudonocardiaceae bacterium]|nr:type IV toxin-antitoxin system AbiEi family antitoxin domain-containing protein [Pseudonocardiaceae bacterium]
MDVDDYLRRQAGVIDHQQALTAGLSGSAVKRRVVSGRWVRLHPRVYLAADHPRTDEVRLRAAVLWAGVGAVAHGVSAAWWHELSPRLPQCVEVTVPRQRCPGRCPDVVVRRRDIDPLDVAEYRDLPVTGIALTVLEAAVALGAGGSVFLDRALQQRVTFGWVHRAHCRNLGRRGSAAASALLTAAADRACSQA